MKKKKALTKMKKKKIIIKHYSSNHKILLIGEGDFSFAVSLAKAFGSAPKIVATCLDSRKKLIEKYSRALDNLDELEKRGCVILYKVDAATMTNHPLLRLNVFDRIVFNFPHAGLLPIVFNFPRARLLWREHNKDQIELHQQVVRSFFKSATKLVTKSGEIHVTHKTSYPFVRWDIVKLADEAGLNLVEQAPFSIAQYPGYINNKGYGYDWKFGIELSKSVNVLLSSFLLFSKSIGLV